MSDALKEQTIPANHSHSTAICFIECGDPRGRPLIYFHGWPSSRLQALHLDKHAREQGIRVIAPDRPGIGGSGFIHNRTLHHNRAFITRLADGLGLDRFAVMGVSGGGPHALATATLLPERVAAASIICSAPPLAELPNRREMILPYRLLMPLRNVPGVLLEPVFSAARWIANLPASRAPMSWLMSLVPPEDRAEIIRRQSCPDSLSNSFTEGLRQGAEAVLADGRIFFQDWQLPYEEIRCPVDFWHGALDKNIPLSMAKYLMNKVPAARQHILQGEGHYSLPFRHTGEMLTSLGEW